MSTSKLPARPSLDSLRKQAKKLARGIVVGDAAAVARARAQLPQPKLPLSQRDAQLLLAREYGFSGWKDLVKEVKQRLGRGLEWAVSEARRIIHDNDVEALRQLLAEYPALLSWKADEFVMREVVRAEHDGELSSFIDILRREAWVLGDRHVRFQAGVIQQAVLHDHEAFITDLLDLNPALLHGPVRPPSPIDFAFTYSKAHLLPILLRIWPLPDDLPHAAGSGDLGRVRKWFDAEGKPALGDLANHQPTNNANYRADFRTWFGHEPDVQQVLDTAFAWAVMNNHFVVADFLLVHGADINTKWSSHEPASILHEVVWRKNDEAIQFLIDRGIDMTIRDFRWG